MFGIGGSHGGGGDREIRSTRFFTPKAKDSKTSNSKGGAAQALSPAGGATPKFPGKIDVFTPFPARKPPAQLSVQRQTNSAFRLARLAAIPPDAIREKPVDK